MGEFGADPALVASQSSQQAVSTKGFDPGELEALAERCEQATGPDRELDADIWKLQPNYGSAISRASGLWPKVCDRAAYERATAQRLSPSYTASLDAAMTLVPAGWGYSICPLSTLLTRRTRHGRDESIMGRGAIPALAVCAAALRARATSQDTPSPPEDM